MRSVAPHPIAHGARERFGIPSADPGVHIGVMLVAKTVPKGVAMGRPPAKGRPPEAVWQVLQLPIAASSAPRATSASSPDCGCADKMGMPDRQANTAKALAATAITATTSSTVRVSQLRSIVLSGRSPILSNNAIIWQVPLCRCRKLMSCRD